MIHTYIVLSVILGTLALVAFFIGLIVHSCAAMAASSILLYIIAFIFIFNDLYDISFFLISVSWIIVGFGLLYDEEIGIGGALILWLIGGTLLWIAIQGNNNSVQPNCQTMVRAISEDGSPLWIDTTRKCYKIDTCHVCFATRDSVPSRHSICISCEQRWIQHYEPSQLMTLAEYQQEQDDDYEEFKCPPFPD